MTIGLSRVGLGPAAGGGLEVLMSEKWLFLRFFFQHTRHALLGRLWRGRGRSCRHARHAGEADGELFLHRLDLLFGVAQSRENLLGVLADNQRPALDHARRVGQIAQQADHVELAHVRVRERGHPLALLELGIVVHFLREILGHDLHRHAGRITLAEPFGGGLRLELLANELDQLFVILFAGVCIYFILAMTLGSFVQPFIVGLPIPFAIMGVIWALKLHNMQLSLMVMLGLIGTMGVAVNDSIVMVHQINLLWKKFGVESPELLIDAAASRLRAIVLTASCTLIGVFPTAYGIGGESGFTQPLAFSMGWGLTASLLLTLFIIPSMLMVLKDVKLLYGRLETKIFNRLISRNAGPPKEAQIDLQY